jgi:hypothetical protein
VKNVVVRNLRIGNLLSSFFTFHFSLDDSGVKQKNAVRQQRTAWNCFL